MSGGGTSLAGSGLGNDTSWLSNLASGTTSSSLDSTTSSGLESWDELVKTFSNADDSTTTDYSKYAEQLSKMLSLGSLMANTGGSTGSSGESSYPGSSVGNLLSSMAQSSLPSWGGSGKSSISMPQMDPIKIKKALAVLRSRLGG